MEHFAPINAISEAIQLSLAPVFLLTGIGAILAEGAPGISRGQADT